MFKVSKAYSNFVHNLSELTSKQEARLGLHEFEDKWWRPTLILFAFVIKSYFNQLFLIRRRACYKLPLRNYFFNQLLTRKLLFLFFSSVWLFKTHLLPRILLMRAFFSSRGMSLPWMSRIWLRTASESPVMDIFETYGYGSLLDQLYLPKVFKFTGNSVFVT